MKKIKLLFLVTFFCVSCSNIKITSFRLKEIVVVKLPHELDLPFALENEKIFDSFSENSKDTNFLTKENFKIELGDRLLDYSYIDIKTKVIFRYSNGKEKVMFLDRFGRVMYKNKIYEGSVEMMNFLRNDE